MHIISQMKKLLLNSKKVKEILQERKLSERALAKIIGTSQARVNYWLTQKSVVGALPIATALKLNAKDLIK